jgi:hypothetical protein
MLEVRAILTRALLRSSFRPEEPTQHAWLWTRERAALRQTERHTVGK